MTRALIIEADGGSRGNPGVAGSGAVVRDGESGALLAERALPLGKASNNVAEYTALIIALRAVQELGLAEDADIDVRMDSQLVIEQMAGRWKIKHADMQRLAAEAQGVVRELREAGAKVRWTWVPRARNKAADALSNDAMDGITITRDHVGRVEDPDRFVGDMGHVAEHLGDAGDEMQDDAEIDEAAAALPATSAFGVSEADLSAGTRVLFVRHGLTDFTVSGRLDGRGGADPALNAEGRTQAQAAAERVRYLLRDESRVRVVASSLRRAQQTATPIAAALGVEVEVDDAFDEQAFGDWDGRAIAELTREDAALLDRMRNHKDVSLPGGESYRALTHRVAAGVSRARKSSGTVVVVTSRRPILSILGELLGLAPGQSWSIAVDPASVTEVTWWADGGAVIGFVNDLKR